MFIFLIFVNFYLLLTLLGGTCGADLKCNSCKDGATPVNGECPLDSCSSINYCK